MPMLLHLTAGTELRGSLPVVAPKGLRGRMALRTGCGLSGRQAICSAMSAGVRGYAPLPHTRHEGLRGGQTTLGSVGTRAQLRSQQVGISRDVPLRHVAPDVAVLLNGADITAGVTALSMRYAQDALHGQVSCTIQDARLFPVLESGVGGTLQVRIGVQAHAFVVEEPQFTPEGCEVWGRSASAVLAHPPAPAGQAGPYAEPVLASVAAADLLPGVAFGLSDWLLPPDYAYAGDPLEGLRQLVGAAGGLVQALPDGSVALRPRYPGGVAGLRGQGPVAATLDSDRILRVSVRQEAARELVDSVEVRGHSASADGVTLAVEGNPAPGQVFSIRAYGAAQPGSPWASSGRVLPLGKQLETVAELLEFVDGVGTASQPVFGELDWEWVGRDPGAIGFSRGARELFLEDGDSSSPHGVARVDYQTAFQRYLVQGVSEEALLFALPAVESGVHAVVRSASLAQRGRQAQEVLEEPLITSDRVAMLRGQTWLLEHAFDRRVISIRVPYQPLSPGDLVAISAPEVRLACRAWVVAVTHQVDASGQAVTDIEAVALILNT